MNNQLVSISPVGTITYLKRKGGLEIPAPKKIERITLIEWGETRQRWFIRYTPPFACCKAAVWRWSLSLRGLQIPPVGADPQQETGEDMPLYFEDYDDAVKTEILFIEALRYRSLPLLCSLDQDEEDFLHPYEG